MHLKNEFIEILIQIINTLHPTAALGIFPKKLDMFQKLSTFSEQKNRGPFGAPFGIYTEHWGHLVVGIRQFQWNKAHSSISFFAGCGVTEKSQFETELDEVKLKIKSIMKVFFYDEQF